MRTGSSTVTLRHSYSSLTWQSSSSPGPSTERPSWRRHTRWGGRLPDICSSSSQTILWHTQTLMWGSSSCLVRSFLLLQFSRKEVQPSRCSCPPTQHGYTCGPTRFIKVWQKLSIHHYSLTSKSSSPGLLHLPFFEVKKVLHIVSIQSSNCKYWRKGVGNKTIPPAYHHSNKWINHWYN